MIATPFRGGMDCWNAADWMVLLSPVCLFVIAILFFFIQRKVKNTKEILISQVGGRILWYPKYKKIEKGFGR